MSKVFLEDVLELSVAERVQLVADIWDSIAADQGISPLTQAQKDEIDRRLEDDRLPPQDISSWEEVKSRVLNGLNTTGRL